MDLIILDKNGVNNTNIDSAVLNDFMAGQRSGVIKGFLNECNITSPSSSVIKVETGCLLISGVRVVLRDDFMETFATLPDTNINYSLIAEIIIDDNADITFNLKIQNSSISLIKEKLFKDIIASGIYQIELATFILTPTGISNLKVKVQKITGGSGSGGNNKYIEIGDVFSEKLNESEDLTVDIENRYIEELNKTVTDFYFGLPISAGSTPIEITLTVADWLENQQTKEIAGKLAQKNCIVSNSNAGTNEEILDNQMAISGANIYKIIDNGTSLTFVCENVPDVDLKILVLVGV